MSNISITITRDDLSPLLGRLKSEIVGSSLSLVMGRAAANLIRENFFALNSARHKYGRNFYVQAARSVSVQPMHAGVTIGIAQQGVRQRLQGGPIRPKNGNKYLTIPASPEAYGMRAGEFNDLDFQMVLDPASNRLRPALVRRLSTPIKFVRRKLKDGSMKTSIKAGEVQGGEVMFWLVRKVEQAADPTVLPPDAKIIEVAIAAGVARLERVGGRN